MKAATAILVFCLAAIVLGEPCPKRPTPFYECDRGPSGIFFPHPEDCTFLVVCIGNQPVVVSLCEETDYRNVNDPKYSLGCPKECATIQPTDCEITYGPVFPFPPTSDLPIVSAENTLPETQPEVQPEIHPEIEPTVAPEPQPEIEPETPPPFNFPFPTTSVPPSPPSTTVNPGFHTHAPPTPRPYPTPTLSKRPVPALGTAHPPFPAPGNTQRPVPALGTALPPFPAPGITQRPVPALGTAHPPFPAPGITQRPFPALDSTQQPNPATLSTRIPSEDPHQLNCKISGIVVHPYDCMKAFVCPSAGIQAILFNICENVSRDSTFPVGCPEMCPGWLPGVLSVSHGPHPYSVAI